MGNAIIALMLESLCTAFLWDNLIFFVFMPYDCLPMVARLVLPHCCTGILYRNGAGGTGSPRKTGGEDMDVATDLCRTGCFKHRTSQSSV